MSNEDIKKFHNDIKNGNLKGVQEFAEKYPQHRLCYGNEKVCALELAIDSRQFDIFSFLRANSFITDKKEILDTKIKNLSVTQKRKIRDANLKYIQKFPNAFIGFLLAKCNFDACSPILAQEIREMIENLSKNENLKTLLQRASEAELRIIFDFVHEDVQNMDPSASEGTLGLTYPSKGEIYVGKDLSQAERYGTFVHELSHAVLNLIYENNCLPYCEGDTVKKEEWKRVLERTKEIFENNQVETEPIIRWVFHYEVNQQQAELAVRPNHILGKYLNNPERVEELKETFKELFDFYENFILPDIRIPNVLQSIKLNNEFGVIEKIKGSHLKLKPLITSEILNHNDRKIILTSNLPKLALAAVYEELNTFLISKIHKKAKNIFVDCEKNYKKDVLMEVINKSQIDRIILDATALANFEIAMEFLHDVNLNIQVFIVCNEDDSKKASATFKIIKKILNFEHLDEKSKEFIRERRINFQGRQIKISKLLNSFPTQIFPCLCAEGDILVNSRNLEETKNFIPRKIQNKSGKSFTIEEFIEETNTDQVVLISNIAGSGKTTFLKKLYEVLRKEYPQQWISFISLKDHLKDLSNDLLKGFGENFVDFFMKILNFDTLEAKIFKEKFSKGEVRILFDAFDEISPKCNKETLKLFELFLSQNKGLKNKILITTRTHLEQDLEKALKVQSFKLKILSDEDQIEFLSVVWAKPTSEKTLVRRCAQQATEKISYLIKSRSSVIGIPVVLKVLAELLQNKINENFTNEIKNMRLCIIYREIIKNSINILNTRFSEKNQENFNNPWSIRHAHDYFVLKHFFSSQTAKDLDRFYNEQYWSLEEITRCGILFYDLNGNVFFIHETYAEFLLAEFIKNILENYENFTKSQVEIFGKIIKEEKFLVTKMFLEEMLEDLNVNFLIPSEDEQTQKFTEIFIEFIFQQKILPNFEEKLVEILSKIKKNPQSVNFFLHQIQKYYADSFVENFLMKVQSNGSTVIDSIQNYEIITDLILNQNNSLSLNGLPKFLIKASEDQETFKMVLEKLENFYRENIQDFYFKSITRDMERVTIFEHLSFHVHEKTLEHFFSKSLYHFESVPNYEDFLSESLIRFSKKNNVFNKFLNEVQKFFGQDYFEKFYLKVKPTGLTIIEFFLSKLNSGNLQQILLYQNSKGETILHFTVSNFEIFEKVLNSISKNVNKYFQKELMEIKNENGENVLQISTQNSEKSLKLSFEFAENLLSKKEMEKFLSEKDKDGDNFLHCAILFAKRKEIFEFLWLKISKIVENPKEFFMQKGQFDRNVLKKSAQNENDPEIFPFVFKLAVSFCASEEEKESLILEKNSENSNLLGLTAYFGPKSSLKFLFENILKIFGINRMKKVFKTEKGFNGKNLLSLNAENRHFDSIEFLWRVFQENLKRNEMLELLNEKDENGDNFLHRTALFVKSELIFEFLWLKVKNLFDDDEKLKNYLKVKGYKGKNILQASTAAINSFFYIFENIFLKFIKIKDFIYECDEDGENLIHSLARFGSVLMLEFSFKKIEEKLGFEELKNLLKLKSKKYEFNLLHCLACNTDKNSIKFLFETIKKYLGKNQIKIMLNNGIKYNFFPLHCTIQFNTSEIFGLFTNFHEENFTKEEIKNILNATDFLDLSKENNKEKNMKEIVKKYYDKL